MSDSPINLNDVKFKEYYQGSRPEMQNLIPENSKKILEIGCGEGFFGMATKKRLSAEVWGVEYDQESAKKAEDKLDKVLCGDINILANDLPEAYFDCIVFNDVLEHLVDPYSILDKMKSKLTPEGVIVSSIPNIRYFLVLKKYLVNRDWKYEEAGVMDRTHLRFFTKKSIIRMFDELDFQIIHIEGINSTKSLKFKIANIISLGIFNDSRYMQYACVVKPK